MSQTHASVDREQLVADLADEYLGCLENHVDVDIQDFLDRCPDAAFERSFLKVVNMTQLFDILAKAEKHRRKLASQNC